MKKQGMILMGKKPSNADYQFKSTTFPDHADVCITGRTPFGKK